MLRNAFSPSKACLDIVSPKLWIIAIALVAWCSQAGATPRSQIPLDAVWSFFKGDVPNASRPRFDDTKWRHVTLPHTFNRADGESGNGYYRGPAWYRTHVRIGAIDHHRRYYLVFDGAALTADVWVNGRELGRHEGGYARFRFDVTGELVVGSNTIAVRVDNSKTVGIAPLGGDFTVFGGLYRSVWLVSTNDLHVSMMDYGGPGVYVSTPAVNQRSAQIAVRTLVKNNRTAAEQVTVVNDIRDAAGHRVATLSRRVWLPSGQLATVYGTTELAHPHLWDGIRDPYLYSVVTTVYDARRHARDRVVVPLGIRSVAITPDRGLVLNGRPYALHGVDYFASERPGRGTAVSDADVDADMKIIGDLGANGIRMVHFQHSQRAYRDADRQGFLVWTEIPLNGVIDQGAAFQANVEQQMRELIAQNYDHPSVIVWGLGNEIYASGPDVLRVLRAVQATAAKADPTRPTVYAHCCQADDAPKAMVADVGGYNRYFGWYPDQKGTLGDWAWTFHARHPHRAFSISEYGAGGSILDRQVDPPPPVPGGPWHPEQYQALFHERSWREIRGLPYIWGSFVWVAFDEASDGRHEGDRNGINDKGLVTYDRATKKDAYYWYQANWSPRPMLHLCDSRFVYRRTDEVRVKVYSNVRRVRLSVNGADVGSTAVNDHVASWPRIRLQPGANVITVRSGSLSDTVTWRYEPGSPVVGFPAAQPG